MTLQGLVEAMQRPQFYPEKPKEVRMIQTHISYLFLTEHYVYKVKKNVDFGFLDFTDLDKRRYYCEKEMELNSRLAPEIYLEVLPISRNREGCFVIGKEGEIVEYALKMKKLPQSGMLKNLLEERIGDSTIFEKIAKKLAEFHKIARSDDTVSNYGKLEFILKNHEENFEQTKPFIGKTISPFHYELIKSYVYNFTGKHEELFSRRVRNGRIRECHGDLHLDHICLSGEEVVIFDCIEFNERFRFIDVAAEVAFFCMDLDFNGYDKKVDEFVEAYIRFSEDDEVKDLLNFYQCYYAYVRGKVSSFRLNEEGIPPVETIQITQTARRYFDLAHKYAVKPKKPLLVIMAGLIGVGKSTVARALSEMLKADLLVSDIIRKEMLNIVPTTRYHEPFENGIYSSPITKRTYALLHEKAEAILKAGNSVIIDASYRNREDRIAALQLAKNCDADFFVLECRCPESEIKKRLLLRALDNDEVSDGRWEIYEKQKKVFEPILEMKPNVHFIFDTTADLTSSLLKLFPLIMR